MIIPLEQDSRWGSHGPSSELVDEMRSAARAAGLIAPHLARADRPALSMRDTARLFRAAGYSPLGPVALNIAIDSVTRSEEHTSELQSLMRISYAVLCLKKKKQYN